METTSTTNRRLAIVAIGGGALLLLTSICALVSFLLVPFLQAENALSTNTSVLAIAAVAIVYGTILLWVGVSTRKNQSSAPLRLPPASIVLVGFILAVVVGQVILSLNFAPAFLFPPFHVLAALGFPLTVLAFVAPRLHTVSLRSVLGQFSWGGLVTIGLAVVFEILIGGFLVLVALLVILLGVGGERMTELMNELAGGITDPQQIMQLALGEPFVLLVAGFTAIVIFVFVVPVLEELLKGSGAAIMISRRERAHMRASKSEVVLWGLAAGAGFAFTENLFNGQGALNATDGVISFWAAAMVLRAGTTLMHMVATATVAVGFFYLFSRNDRKRFLQLFCLALFAHAAWNSGAVLLAVVSASSQVNQDLELLSACLVIGMLLFLAGLFVGFLFWLRRLIRWAMPPVEIVSASGTIPSKGVT